MPSVHPIFGGMFMNAQAIWSVFMDTGSPEIYLLYHEVKKLEETNVYIDPGAGSEGNGLQ